jgi:DNA-binding transcriptional MerR regulator
MAQDSRKLFYSIGEVAALFDVNESLLRFWEKEFPTTIKPKKNAKGTRSYTKEDIESIRLIYFMVKEKGMTLAGAKKRIKEEKKGVTAQFELADRLKKIKVELLKLQEELGRPEVPEEDPKQSEEKEVVAKRMVFPAKEEVVRAENVLEELNESSEEPAESLDFDLPVDDGQPSLF